MLVQLQPNRIRPAYESFLALCKDADPDIGILKQAKTEDARLRQLPSPG